MGVLEKAGWDYKKEFRQLALQKKRTKEYAVCCNLYGLGACAVLWIGIALMNIYGILSHPDMVEPGRWIIVFMQLYVAAVLLGRNAAYVIWHRKSLRQIEAGGGCADMKGIRLFDRVTMGLFLVIIAVYAKAAGSVTAVFTGAAAAAVVLLIIALAEANRRK